jgi:hypothetical protein
VLDSRGTKEWLVSMCPRPTASPWAFLSANPKYTQTRSQKQWIAQDCEELALFWCVPALESHWPMTGALNKSTKMCQPTMCRQETKCTLLSIIFRSYKTRKQDSCWDLTLAHWAVSTGCQGHVRSGPTVLALSSSLLPKILGNESTGPTEVVIVHLILESMLESIPPSLLNMFLAE